jgi:hypothetical protein
VKPLILLASRKGLEPQTCGLGNPAHSKKQPEKPEIPAQKNHLNYLAFCAIFLYLPEYTG